MTSPVSADEVSIMRNVEFANVNGQQLLLDLYLPRQRTTDTLVVWVHGGAWRSGSKASVPLVKLTEQGVAIASVDYRLSPVARFPAQVHDIKAAIRFLRSEGKRLGCPSENIVIAGASAGGHLAALVGVTNGNAELEGTVGDHSDESSDVQGIIDFYGPTNFLTILQQSTPHGLNVRVPALQLLLGSQPTDNQNLARLASPVFHVDQQSPPLVMYHGDQDPQVPVNQSLELLGVYQEQKLSVKFHVVHGGAHGGAGFYSSAQLAEIYDFVKSVR